MKQPLIKFAKISVLLFRRCQSMKNVYEVLRQKELELARLEKEVEALRVAAPLLSEDKETAMEATNNKPTLASPILPAADSHPATRSERQSATRSRSGRMGRYSQAMAVEVESEL